ncbi:MarR family transcriptional regulator [Altererythrobacter indicus]|uniref:MarR family transcriptional regulator n=1 Tax=Altericroceibacterium indicum TaxID=374177 RepID=A0A845ACJ1_9SPHN|nr:MarR family winged helix-turn-helix transcriptional regulator [Altericroceibacterium indicum]MXP27109.1 MarR family transcriptional regulator [Altericroceibacterium indicum]
MNGQDPTSMEALYQRPGFIIRRAHQIVLALFDEEAAELGLTTTQYSVLHTLRARPGINQMGLCELIGIDRSTATMVLRLLERNGLVERRQSEKDRRRNTLMLTSAGEDLLIRAAPLSKAISERMREVLSEEELSQLSRLLGQFVQSFNHRVRNPLLPDTAAGQIPSRASPS